MRVIPPEVFETVRSLRAEGVSWDKAARVVGFDRDVLRYRLDPKYAERQRGKYSGPPSTLRAAAYRPSSEELAALLSRVPRDTRSMQAKWLGDPLPGRSALDQKREARQVFHTKIGSAQGRAG